LEFTLDVTAEVVETSGIVGIVLGRQLFRSYNTFAQGKKNSIKIK
jgi:hypothetical protein